jgi:hypothetical protein
MSSNSLFVGGLNRDVTEESLNQLFGSFGVCRINLFPTYAFIDYESPQDAEEAFNQINSGGPLSNLNGLQLRVEWSRRSRKGYASTEQRAGEASAGAGASGGCFECGSMDHRVRDCPVRQEKERLGGGGAGRGAARYGSEGRRPLEGGPGRAGSGGARVCYNCGGVGHTSRECPSERGVRGNMGDRGPGSSGPRGYPSTGRGAETRSCFKCGESGHLARFCPTTSAAGPDGNAYGSRGRRENSRPDRRDWGSGHYQEPYSRDRDSDRAQNVSEGGAGFGNRRGREDDRYDFGNELNEEQQTYENRRERPFHSEGVEEDEHYSEHSHDEGYGDYDDDNAGSSVGQKRRLAGDAYDSGHHDGGSDASHGDGNSDDDGDDGYQRDSPGSSYGADEDHDGRAQVNGSYKRSRHGNEGRGSERREAPSDYAHSDWNSLTLKDLKAEAEKRGIDTTGMRLKKDYVEALENAAA